MAFGFALVGSQRKNSPHCFHDYRELELRVVTFQKLFALRGGVLGQMLVISGIV